jgi:hypothetical protein
MLLLATIAGSAFAFGAKPHFPVSLLHRVQHVLGFTQKKRMECLRNRSMAGNFIEEDFLVRLGNIISFRFRAPAGLAPGKYAAQFASFFLTTFTEYDGSCTKADWISSSFAVAMSSFWFK